MIFSFRGKLIAKNGLLIVIEISGIGYGVLVSTNSLLALPDIGRDIVLYIHQIIREDAHVLYGFLEETEKFLFCELIKISGVGGKLALAILSHMTVEQFIETIQLKNLTRLINIPGVGKKTAQRLMVEMQNNFQDKKLKDLFTISGSKNNAILKDHKNTVQDIINDNVINDVQEALIALGYKPKEAISVVRDVVDVLDIDIKNNNNSNSHNKNNDNNNHNNNYLNYQNSNLDISNIGILDMHNKNKIVEELLKRALRKLATV